MTSQAPPRAKPASLPGLASYVQVVLIAALSGATSLVYLRFFATQEYLLPTMTAAAVGAAVAGVCAARRWGLWTSIGLSVLGFVLVSVFAVLRDTLNRGVPTLDTLTGLGTATVDGWARMLSVSLPADPTADLTFTPTLLTWAAAAASATIIVRTKAIALPLLFPLLAYLLGLLFSAPRAVDGLALPAALLVVALLLVLIRAGVANKLEHAGARAITGHLAFGIPVIAVAATAGVLSSQYLPIADGTGRFDPRTVLGVELAVGDHLSPLVTMKSQLREPEDELFTIALRGEAETVDRIRLAALERYDGSLWSSQDTYLLAGSKLEPATPIEDPQRVTATVEITGSLPGPYLPSLGVPTGLTADRAGYSAESGVLVTDRPVPGGGRYELTAELAGTAGLAAAVPLVGTDSGRYIDLPDGLPPEMSAKAAELAGSVDEPFAKLTALQDFLRTFPYSLDARPGHSYDSLARLFSANPDDRIGYAEQFAATFAVMARSQGFPTRVVVGYLLRAEDRDGETYTVRSGDAHAWAEVHFDGYGWVAFDPTDPERRAGNPPEDEQQGGQQPAEPEQERTASQPGEDTSLPNLAAAATTLLDWALWVLIALGALLVATPFAIAAEKFRRRRARRTGSRAAKIIGAWQESADRLTETGVGVSASSTTTEVARQAQAELGEPAKPVAVLAPIAAKAMYSPAEPGEDTVEQAWQLTGQLNRDLRKARGPLAMVRDWVDPRPLFARVRDGRRRKRSYDQLTKG